MNAIQDEQVSLSKCIALYVYQSEAWTGKRCNRS